MFSNAVMDTQPLNHRTAEDLKSCESISYGSECGWFFAYGRDKNGNLLIAVHSKSDIRNALEDKFGDKGDYFTK